MQIAGSESASTNSSEKTSAIYMGFPEWKKDNYDNMSKLLADLFNKFGFNYQNF